MLDKKITKVRIDVILKEWNMINKNNTFKVVQFRLE